MYRSKKAPGKKSNLSQFGLLDIPDLDDGDEPMDLSDDDIDLEAELAAISGGSGQKHRPRKPAPVPAANLDAMIAESLKDIPSDEDVSGDEEDPDLLSELNELATDEAPRTTRPAPPPPSASISSENSTVSLLQDRISNYTLAEKTAKQNGETSRARRFGRGIKTLNDLLKQAKAGKPIKDDDIPPPVPIPKSEPQPPRDPLPPPPIQTTPTSPPSPPPPRSSPPAPPVPPRTTSVESPNVPETSLIDLGPSEPGTSSSSEQSLSPEKQEGLQLILRRKNEFKQAALSSKHAGDKTMALEYLKVVKQFDIVADAYKAGQEMDLSELPTVESIAAALKSQTVEETNQKSSEPAPVQTTDEAGLITASSVDEALKQRLAYYQQQESKAKEEGNSSKARRLGRIVKQFHDSIKLNAAGRPISVEDLPTPPGYAPIPGNNAAPSPAAPAHTPRPAPAVPSPSTPSAPARPTSRYNKQIAFLMQRQKQFKDAAIKSKKEGNIEQAKEYLRAAKGFDAVIEAAKGGLTIDLKSLPLPPKAKTELEQTFDVVSPEDCDPGPSAILASDDDVISRVQQQLHSQLLTCHNNRDHNAAMGNVAEANRFDHLALSVKQDLDLVAVAKSTGQIPKFHYESRKFAVVQCNTDLNENDLELTIVRGIAYNVPNPKEVDTYVRFEFGYPQDAPASDRTSTVKDTNSPQYNAVFPLSIHRGNRACLRFFKRHAIKLEVFSKGGWFKSDSILGTVNVKLLPLETQVTLHESYPLMDGRRPAGGSLEVKLRVRTPLVQQQIEQTTHRWLIIDN